jgi:hypothetical protein
MQSDPLCRIVNAKTPYISDKYPLRRSRTLSNVSVMCLVFYELEPKVLRCSCCEYAVRFEMG